MFPHMEVWSRGNSLLPERGVRSAVQVGENARNVGGWQDPRPRDF